MVLKQYFFFKKIISVKICYKIYNNKLLINIKVYKTWDKYLKNYQYKIPAFINYNNLY